MFKTNNAAFIAVLGFLLYGCAASGQTSGEGSILNTTIAQGATGRQQVNMGSVPSGEDSSDADPVPVRRGPRSFGIGMPGGGMASGTVLEGNTTHIRYVPLHRPEIGGYVVMFTNNTRKYQEVDGDGVATCNRDSMIVPDERRSKWHVRIDRDGVEHYLLKPGATVCLTIDADDACPPNVERCEVQIRGTEYSFSAPVVRRERTRGGNIAIPTSGPFGTIRFDQ